MRKDAQKRRKASPRRVRVPFERGMVYAVAFFVFALPLFVWPASTEYGYTKSILALVAVSLLLALWGIRSALRGEWPIRLPWVSAPVAALTVASLLSLLGATNGRVVIQSLVLLVFFALFGILVANVVKRESDVSLVLFSLLVSASVASLYGLLQYLGILRGPFGATGLSQMISTVGNRNYLGEFLATLLFPSALLVFRLRSRPLRALAIVLIAFSFGTALLVHQTSVVVALVVTLVAFLVALALFRPIQPLLRNKRWLLALLVLLVLTFLIESPSGPLNSVVGLSADGTSWFSRFWEQNSGRTRSWDWWVGWEMFKDHPIVGAGLGNYKLDFLPYKAQFLASPQGESYQFYIPRAAQAHNEYVQVAAETGIVGVIALLALLAAIPISFWKRLRANPDEGSRLDLVLIGCGVVSFLVVALVGFPAHLPTSALALVTLLGLAFSEAYGSKAEVAVHLRGRGARGLAAGVILVGIVVSVVALRDFSADVLLGKGILELGQGQARLAEETLLASASRDFSPQQVHYYLAVARIRQGRYEEAKADLGRCLTRFVDEVVYLYLANLSVNLGDTPTARRAVDLLLATEPRKDTLLQGRYLEALITLREGDGFSAAEKLDQLTRDAPTYEAPYLALGELYRGRGMNVTARKAYETALQLINEKIAAAQKRIAPGTTVSTSAYGATRAEIDGLTQEKNAVEAGLSKLP
jgi:O-antigen ligase